METPNIFPFGIRELAPPQIHEAMDLVWKVFLEFEAPGYDAWGVAHFRKFIAVPKILGTMKDKSQRFWGCYNESRIVGVVGTRQNTHICLLFVDKEYHHRGIARRLFETALLHNPDCVGASRFTVNSSTYAKKAYRHLGFTETDSLQVVDNIPFIPMEYKRNRQP